MWNEVASGNLISQRQKNLARPCNDYNAILKRIGQARSSRLEINKIPQLTFINLVTEPWDSPWLSRQGLMSCLSRKHRVIFVLKEPALDSLLGMFGNGQFPRARILKINESIYELQPGPLQPKIYFSPWLDKVSRQLRFRKIRQLVNGLGWGNPILYVWNPHFQDVVGRADEILSVFHIHDHYPSFDKFGTEERAQAERDYAKLIRDVDLVFACSETLLKTVQEIRYENVYHIENGVEYARFSAARLMKQGTPRELASLPRPIIGNIGRIDSRVDIELMTELAKQRPGWTMLLLGPKVGTVSKFEAALEVFRALPNAVYVEGKSVTALPTYVNSLDVGLLCYKTEGTWMPYGSPLKMFEYFAVGKPAVCSYISSLEKYEPVLRMARTRDAWIPLIEDALQENSSEAVQRRIAIAESNSWERRAEIILDTIARHPKFLPGLKA